MSTKLYLPWFLGALQIALTALSPVSVSAAPPSPSVLCDQAAYAVSVETGVPLDVLRAITLTETGRTRNGAFEPWPWTVNMEGAGKWFDERQSAQAYVDGNFARGARSFDVGCFQINYRWHGDAFSSIEEMFDPLSNARYAARFLTELHREFGDWSKAAGAYHSRTPKFATKYARRFDRIRARLPAPLPSPIPDPGPVDIMAATVSDLPSNPKRENTFPLLVAGGAAGRLASLVPSDSGQNRTRFLVLGAAQPLSPIR